MRKTIQENNTRFTAAHIRRDGELIDNMFARDGKVMLPESEPEIGREAISKVTPEYIAAGISEFKEETTDFCRNEDVLVDQATYLAVNGKDKAKEVGKYLNVWRKEDGFWNVYADIWNTNHRRHP